jgi:hypothetical protein
MKFHRRYNFKYQGNSSDYDRATFLKNDKHRLKLVNNISKFHPDPLFPVTKCNFSFLTLTDKSIKRSRKSSRTSFNSTMLTNSHKNSELVHSNHPKHISILKINGSLSKNNMTKVMFIQEK